MPTNRPTHEEWRTLLIRVMCLHLCDCRQIVCKHPQFVDARDALDRLDKQIFSDPRAGLQIDSFDQIPENDTYDCPIHGNMGLEECPRC